MLGRLVTSVLRGVAYLLSLKILHRDIKPSNILINSAGIIKLCDFGVSAQLTMSYTHTFVGTNAYMAPERINGQPYTVQSEVWSLGLSLMELAVGRFPYPSGSNESLRQLSPIELAQCIVNDAPPRLPDGCFRPELVDFVARCLIPQPSQRPTPNQLMTHPYFEIYARVPPGDQEIVLWIQSIIATRSR